MKSLQEIIKEDMIKYSHQDGSPCVGKWCLTCIKGKALRDSVDRYIFQVGE